MPDLWVKLAILGLRPFEKWHEWTIKRAYAKGRFTRPDRACVTTRPRRDDGMQ